MVLLTVHLSHLLMFASPVAVFALLFWCEWHRTSTTRVPAALRLMAATGAAAGLLHGTVVGHHAAESALLGWFFAGLCVTQLTLAYLLLLTSARRVVVAGVVVNLGAVCLWAWSRSVGLPVALAGGHQGGERIAVACTALEVGAVLAGLAWVYSATGGRSSRREAASKWDTSTTRNSPLPLKVSTP